MEKVRKPKHILIADDDNDLSEVISWLVNDIKCTFERCTNGEDALNLVLSGKPFDLIVTDITMPKLNGLDFVAGIRDKGFLIPVIVVTGYPSGERNQRAWKLSSFTSIEKPFDPEQLKMEMKKALAGGQNLVEQNIRDGNMFAKPFHIMLDSVTHKKIRTLAESKKLSAQALVEEWILKGLENNSEEKAS